MRAVTFSQYGTPSVLSYTEVEDPEPGPDEVLIRVRACGLNHLDLDIRAGRSRYPIRFPHILGREVAGEVLAVGANLGGKQIPPRVLVRSYFTCWRCAYCHSGQDNHCPNARLPGLNCWGGYAELMVAPETELIPLPASLSFVEAAAAQIVFGTAWRSLVVLGRVSAGQDVLVLGGSGGVGSAAIQVAALFGARVLTITRHRKKALGLENLGTDALIATTPEEMIARVRQATGNKGVDIVVDPVGGETTAAALDLLKPGGRLVVSGAHTGEIVQVDLVKLFRNQSYLIGSRRSARSDLESVLPLLVAGKLHPIIDQVAPLADAPSMHVRMAGAEHTGKIVLSPDS